MSWLKRLKCEFERPEFLLILNRTLKWFWIALILPIELIPGLKTNVNIVILLSLYANMATNWGAERALESQLETARDTGQADG